jgi:hypothetical protein
MDEKVGIKESKELLKGVVVLSAILIEKLKDGFQVSDLPTILSRLGYDNDVRAALDGIGAIPSELKDLSLEESMELAMTLLSGAPLIINKLKQ